MATINMNVHLDDDELLRARHNQANGTYWLTLCFGREQVTTYFRSAEEARTYWLAIQSAALKVEALRKQSEDDAAAFEAAKHSDPCTEEAREHGCTCSMESSHSASIDPPEPIVDRECPLHGDGFDPDAARDARIDHEMMGIV